MAENGAESRRLRESGVSRRVEQDNEIREDGRTVDALASAADEGRGHAAKRPGEPRWQAVSRGYPNGATRPGDAASPETNSIAAEGTGGTETSQYPEEKRVFPE